MESLIDAILEGGDVRPLLEQGESPNVYGEVSGAAVTPLLLAVFRGLTQVAQALLEAGANPNSEVLPSASVGPYSALVGMTPTDLAATLEADDLVKLLVRQGGRPGRRTLHRGRQTLRRELERARSVDAAHSLVAEAVLLPLVEKAQGNGKWDEADRLLAHIMRHEAEGERSLHLRIRGLLARGLTAPALEEASLVFVRYRAAGRVGEALQVARCMRLIDPASSRPYELELEFLTSLGWMTEARSCLEELVDLHRRAGNQAEIRACTARFALLSRRPLHRAASRLPRAWTVPEALPTSNSGNLPAVLEENAPTPSRWWEKVRRLWWG